MQRQSNTWNRRLLFTMVVMLICLGYQSSAHARRGIVVINTGEDVMQISEVSLEMREQLGETGVAPLKFGIRYSRFGVFWLDIARWNAEYCLYREEMDETTIFDVPREDMFEIAGVTESSVSMPIRYYAPPGGVVLALSVLGLGAMVVLGTRKENQRRQMMENDPRYQQAKAIFLQEPESSVQERFLRAVQYLCDHGISRDTAIEDLKLLLDLDKSDEAASDA